MADEQKQQQPPSPLALTRSRRANAGAKMSQLINEQDKGDDFYATTYGGFAEEEDDQDYEAKSDDNDEADSDFDNEISEDDNNNKDGEEDEEEGGEKRKKKKKTDDDEYDEEEDERRKKRKALKRKRLSVAPESKTDTKKSKKTSAEVADSSMVEEQQQQQTEAVAVRTSMKRSALRTSTQIKSEMGEARRKVERAIWSKKKEQRDKSKQYRAQFRRRLTQAELLEEAKITERLNIESLERFRQFEELRKAAQRVVKQRKVLSHLCIRFSSVTNKEDATSHNFVSFGDKKMFDAAFRRQQQRKPPPVARKICPLTGLPAKYFDPVTQLPYANLQAFKMLRQIHADAVKKQDGGGRS